MDPRPYTHQIEFKLNIDTHLIVLHRLYPTYPEISGFEILQFITNLAFQCKLLIHVFDLSDISKVYSALYGVSYYQYHLKGIDLSQKFLFEKIIVKRKKFLNCFDAKIEYLIKILSELFYKNIQVCEKAFVSIEFCPITFDTQRIFYKNFKICIDWSPIEGYQDLAIQYFQRFQITSEDIIRINMKSKQKSNSVNFAKINQALTDKQIIKTYDQIKTQIFDNSFLIKLFSTLFEFCFSELEKRYSTLNPEDIFKLYLRPCVIPNINRFLKYYTI
jgi:hypothetical protein